jgi:hypothetical protein
MPLSIQPTTYSMKWFVILAQIRTGYQLLANQLHHRDDILSLGEIFVYPEDVRIRSLFGAEIRHFEVGEPQKDYLRNIVEPYAKSIGAKATGFKLNYTDHELWPYIRQQRWHVIHLVRQNLLDRLLSEKLAVLETKWNYKEYTQQVEISLEELEGYSEDSYMHQRRVDSLFSKNPMLKVMYEDLAVEPAHRVIEFLDLTPGPLVTTMPKQRSGCQRQFIRNYDQLYEQIIKKKPEYKKFLTDIPIM